MHVSMRESRLSVPGWVVRCFMVGKDGIVSLCLTGRPDLMQRQGWEEDGRGFLQASCALRRAASCAQTLRCGAQVEQSTRSTNRSFKKMVSQGMDPAEIYKAICSQCVELIFTAHPTQARSAQP